MPERLVPAMVAANSASTLRSSFNSNGEPQKRWIRPATMTASPAFATAENTEFQMLRSLSKLAAIVAATTPTTTVHRAAEPRAIKIPEATPAAGQNTATPSTGSSNARLSRACAKIGHCHYHGQHKAP